MKRLSVSINSLEAILITIIFLQIISCKDNKTATSNTQVTLMPQQSMVVCSQDYNTLMGYLLLNDSLLIAKGVKAYSSYQSGDKAPHKAYFKSLGYTLGSLRACELHGKDTLMREKILAKNGGTIKTEKVWKAIHRKAIVTEFQHNGLSYTIMSEKGRNDTTIYKPYSFTKYSNGDKLTYTEPNKGRLDVTYQKANGKILFQYQDELSRGLPVKRTYTKGSHHIYIFFYDHKNQLSKVVWKENANVLNATIHFEYNHRGLLTKRIIESRIPVFGNSTTVYTYY